MLVAVSLLVAAAWITLAQCTLVLFSSSSEGAARYFALGTLFLGEHPIF